MELFSSVGSGTISALFVTIILYLIFHKRINIRKDEDISSTPIEEKKSETEKEFNKEIVLNWLEEKWPEDKRICDICRTEKYEIPKYIVNLPGLIDNQQPIRQIVYPKIMAICSYCGNTKFFNAKLMGLSENDNGEIISLKKKS
jgi:hypothetical protein